MTDNSDDWEPHERLPWQPKTPREEREALDNAPLATLRATPGTREAFMLMGDLAERYPRPQAAKGKAYARRKTLVDYANAVGAFIADLLAAVERDRSEGWLMCSHNKGDYSGQYVTWRMFDGVRTVWLEAGLIEHKPGYPGRLAFGNPGPTAGKLTRYRATTKLLEIAAEHGITPANVLENFKFEFVMPSELIRLTQPSMPTPNTPRVAKLRSDVAELNAFFAKQTLTPPTIKHLGWIRMFHGYTKGYQWNKGGRLYSQPQGQAYQNLPETSSDSGELTRLQMRINGERVVEIDISSSNLTIFYALCDQQLDSTEDAFAGILGPTALDRHVAKFWINASFGNSKLLGKWSNDLVKSLEKQLIKKGLSGFDQKRYPMKTIKEKVLERHPLLARWGGEISGRQRDYGDLMFVESEVIIGTMLTLMRDYEVPSLPVHDSLIIPASKFKVAKEALIHHFRKQTGAVPRLDPEEDPEDW
ncbi:hypothetical protein IVB44_01505 [Bradyrhizobium sp. 49]|uniref:hypothetical protein n=1 Tax=unclassified Bradyrhizobium TaxID=2631580 RepID=UPI001FF899E1|nr:MULTISPECIES: hypothetical protein [unclassified Bradyrhizobium]MCK1266878.1 hypothetical protein [Bradyrhizobium sp. 84]MCK1369742.1 hypothetical protein [Bradyrhizobium sp. 49]